MKQLRSEQKSEYFCRDESKNVAIPEYLSNNYWWAYLHPRGVRLFERQWVVNLILFGNYRRLCNEVIEQIGNTPDGHTLQIACVYGDLSQRLAYCHRESGYLDVVDVAQIQLDNLKRKLAFQENISLILGDSTQLKLPDKRYQHTLLFFLLHEQPWQERIATLQEAVRVTSPGGKLIIIDYHSPKSTSPMSYLLPPLFDMLEPYAIDLWRHDISSWLPDDIPRQNIVKQTYFGGLYQKVVVTSPE